MMGDQMLAPNEDDHGISTSMCYKLADMIMLRVCQKKEGGPTQAKGELLWSAPWGKERIDFLKKARVRHTADGGLFAYLECIGNLDICAGLHKNGTRFFVLIDSSRGQIDIPEMVPSIVKFVTDISPGVVAGFTKDGDGEWQKIKSKPKPSS
jgi:hypothetical protein